MSPPPDYRQIATQKARQYGVPVNVFLRQINQESGFRPNARSGAGAEGIAQFMPATAKGYGVDPWNPVSALDGAARMDAANLKKYGSVQSMLSVYNSGSADKWKTPGSETYNYVRSVLGGGMGGAGAGMPSPQTPAATSPSGFPVQVQQQDSRQGLLQQLGKVNDGDYTGFYQQLGQTLRGQQAQPIQPSPVAGQLGRDATASTMPGQQPVRGVKPGAPVARETSVSSEHPTAGLAGFPARDYFAPSGSAAVAPISGTVVRLSGHDPRQGPIEGPHGPLGWSVYIRGTDGHEYYLTHMGSRNVKVGQTVKAGQPIGTVADYQKYGTPSHIHMGVRP